jgi:hypothetical protein
MVCRSLCDVAERFFDPRPVRFAERVATFLVVAPISVFLLSKDYPWTYSPPSEWLIPMVMLGWSFGFLFGAGRTKIDTYRITIEILAVVILFPLLVLLSLATAPFGSDTALLAPLLEFTAESTPPGEFAVVQMPSTEELGMAHSAPYKNEHVLRQIGSWIIQRRDESNTT